jgi:3-isopropylmalate/(R)-2-methylmalate dehydratase small subunit
MTPFTLHCGVAAPLLRDHIDTDTIIPSREMRTVSRSGLADGLFAPWRYSDVDARLADPDFVLNQASYEGASILLTGLNFGCGSSREHAVWAMMEWGVKVVIAPSFATIFRNNALCNGLLTIELATDRIQWLANWVATDPQINQLTVDLQTCSVSSEAGREKEGFQIDPMARSMLIEGLDEIGLTEQSLKHIEDFENRDQVRRPWAYLADPH